MNSGLPIPTERALHSWKEIAHYTGRGVRTIQRYEVKLGFPIRRPAGKPRSAVLAFPHEIDQWLAKSPTKIDGATEEHPPEPPTRPQARSEQLLAVDLLYENAKAQMERAAMMTERMRQTQDLVKRMTAFVETAREERKELQLRTEANRQQIAELRRGGIRGAIRVASAP